MGGPVRLQVLQPSHPIFAGIPLDASNTMVNTYADVVNLPFPPNTPQRGISVVTNPAIAGAQILARVDKPGDLADGGTIVAEFSAGLTTASSNPTALGARRLVFLTGTRESAITSEAAGLLDLSADGQAMFLNAVRYMANSHPDCSNAVASMDVVWPPNHHFVPITVEGVTDPDGDPVTITIDGIFQDEPLDSLGDGSHVPDGMGVGTDTAHVRAERAGTKEVPGDGRVYHIFYTASDGRGGDCDGEITVCVPHDRGQGINCVDSGVYYDSTGIP
jgi:hypothetical protein